MGNPSSRTWLGAATYLDQASSLGTPRAFTMVSKPSTSQGTSARGPTSQGTSQGTSTAPLARARSEGCAMAAVPPADLSQATA